MASSGEDPPDRNRLTFNPFKLLGISSGASEKEVTKAYKSLIKTSHPDKVKGREGLATRITQAYNLLKNADEKRRKELEKAYSGGGAQMMGNASNIIVDKTLSEEYKRVFQAHVEVAKGSRFVDNFQSFYKQLFDHVETPPVVDSELCELCEDKFISREEHDEAVFSPYLSYLIEDAPEGVVEYLDSLFGEEILRPYPVKYTTGIWGDNLWSTENCQFSLWIDYFKDAKLGPLAPKLANELVQQIDGDIAVGKWIKNIPNFELESVQDIGRSVLAYFAKFSSAEEILPCDIILPAFLQAFTNFKDWTSLALHFASLNEPRWAVLFARAGFSVDPNVDDNHFLKVADSLLDVDWRSAHICYLLGSYDLNLIGKRLAATRTNIQARKLAAQYLLKTKDYESLLNVGTRIAAAEDRLQSAIFLLPLFFHYLGEEGDVNKAISVLGIMLPKKKLWRCIQSLVMDELGLSDYEAVAFQVVKNVEETVMVGILLSLAGVGLDDDGLRLALEAVPGALHILECSDDNQELYKEAREITDKMLFLLMETALERSQLPLMVTMSRFPGAAQIMRNILTDKRFLGSNSAKPQPGQVFHSCLLLLRGIYNYKIGNIPGMIQDLETASVHLVGNKLVTGPISDFLTGNTLIHERILEAGSHQFSKLQDYIDDYSGDDFDPSKFPLLMCPMTPDESSPLSQVFQIGGGASHNDDGSPDLRALEKDVLGREGDADNDGGNDNDPENLAEKGYAYVNLSIIAESVEETVLCYAMAASFFFKAMFGLPETSFPEKFAYHGLMLKTMKALKPYSMAVSQPPSILMFVRRLRLSFIFQANHHISQCLRKQQPGTTTGTNLIPVNFLDENKVPKMTTHWQSLVNTKLCCPISTKEAHTLQDGILVMAADAFLNNALLMKRIERGVFSPNVPDYLYHQILFNEVWSRRVDLKKLEQAADDVELELDSEEEIDDDEDDEVKKSKTEKNGRIREEKENLEKALKAIPIIHREAFKTTRAEAMKALADLHGYGMDQVEHMMNWHVIRRTPEGFIDTSDRSLNFDGEPAFSKFLGVRVNPSTKVYELLLEPAVPGDAERPPLFTMGDIDEIFGLEIAAANLSFDEQQYRKGLPEFEKITLPVHPFFHVSYKGIRPNGESSKGQICGTNFLMTLYHLDLLAKMLTTGQEVGANFPFEFRDTESHLLKGVEKELRRSLMPIGPRKKARLLRNLELIHRFWFHAEKVEQFVEKPSQQNGGVIGFRYGNATLTLKTMPMIRDEDGKVIDAEGLMDENGAELQFVREFNRKMPLIEKLFPIIGRTKELSKISLALEMLYLNKEIFAKEDPNFGQIFGMTRSPQTRPYSNCGGGNNNNSSIPACTCCDWVPAVYHEMLVTDEQKLEELFGNRFFNGKDSITGEERGKLTYDGAEWAESESTQAGEEEKETNKKEDGEGKDDESSSKSKLHLPQWNLLEKYRVYGGVQFMPIVETVLTLAQIFPLGRVIGTVLRLANAGCRMLRMSRRLPPPRPLGGGSGGRGRGPGGGNKVHLNSRKSQKPTYVYSIYKNGTLYKTGISSVPPTSSGKLQRMETQLRGNMKASEAAGSKDVWTGKFNARPYLNRNAARRLESYLTKKARRNDTDPNNPSLPGERGWHPDNIWEYYGAPKGSERAPLQK